MAAILLLLRGGGIGDALFFFVSGFTLFLGRKMDFVNWYKKRLGRIFPTVIAMGLVSSLIFSKESSFIDIMSVSKYWFLQCILICYILLYPVVRYEWKLTWCILVSIAIMIGSYFLFEFDGTMFYGVNNCFRWIVYLSVMLIGGYIFLNINRLEYKWWSIPLALLFMVMWYGIIYISNGNALQLLSYLPLIGICVTLYQIGKAPMVKKLFDMRICGNILFIIGNLCLESYLIQRYIFTDALNNLFPLNIPLIMITVLASAYLLHILSGVISQIFDSKPFDWKGLLLYKK